MGIGDQDLNFLLEKRKNYTGGKTCAILGNCTFHFKNGSKEKFREIMNFDTVDTFDINGDPTYKLDLQEPLEESFKNKYDWVLDAGTLYCVFDMTSCWKNIIYMLRPDGKIWHQTNLVGHFGRGFYSLSPSAFNEFYRVNGFKIENLQYLIKGGSGKLQNIQIGCNYLHSANMKALNFVKNNCSVRNQIPCDTSLFCFVSREKELEFKKPIPEHYIKTKGK